MGQKANIIQVKHIAVNVLFSPKDEDYISLTDSASFKNPNGPKDVVKNCLRNRSTIEFLGLWEHINNPDFKGSNSTPFCMHRVATALHSRQVNGSSKPSH